jgi:hypothetical protein
LGDDPFKDLDGTLKIGRISCLSITRCQFAALLVKFKEIFRIAARLFAAEEFEGYEATPLYV